MDRKRFRKESLPISFFHPENTGLQPRSNRSINQQRPIFLKTGLINQANGSAYLELDKIKVIASVHLRQISRNDRFSEEGKVHCEFKFCTFAFEKRVGFQRNDEEKEYSQLLHEAISSVVRLDLYPKSTIDVFVNVLESDGKLASLSCALNCVTLALADAGIEMYDLVVSACASFVYNEIYVDPTSNEEEHQQGSILIAFMPSINEISHIVQSGCSDASLIVKSIELTMESASQVHRALSQCLTNNLK